MVYFISPLVGEKGYVGVNPCRDPSIYGSIPLGDREVMDGFDNIHKKIMHFFNVVSGGSKKRHMTPNDNWLMDP